MINRNSETWLTIEAHINEQLELKRDRLESIKCDGATANLMRGYIAAMKDLMELADEQSSA